MSDFTFLTAEQCLGENKLDIFKKRGTVAALTDFAILLGANVTNNHINSDSSLAGRTGSYWTRTKDANFYNNVYVVRSDDLLFGDNIDLRSCGGRPVLPFSEVSLNCTNVVNSKRASDGILEVEYGYYPQSAVSKEMQLILKKTYKDGAIWRTGNIYTTDSRRYNEYSKKFLPKHYEEYEYLGKRYIRVELKSNYPNNELQLSNGESYKVGDIVWVEVEPVKWLFDEKSQLMVTVKIIFAGVRFNDEVEKFDKTEIKKFMDEHLWRDMFQYREKQTTVSAPSTRTGKSYDFDFTDASNEDIIKSALKSNVAIFLHGKPGCGKSDRVKQLDPDFIELNLSHLDPELLDGLAGEKDGKEVHIKPPWLEELEEKCKVEPDKIHILFLEELTNASPVMQSKAYGIALDKKVAGRWKLPENARVVAAGNELEDTLVANEMAEPLYDRFAHVNIETTKENWLEWAVTPESYYSRLDYVKEDTKRPKIHPAIYGYISLRGDEVLRTPYNKEHPQPHADPRRWKMASDMLYASNNPSTLKAIVGEDLTKDFIAFCQIPTISIEDVLKGNYTEDEIEKMDIGMKLATISGLVAVDTENMPKIREFAKKLGPEMCKKFEIQWTHGDEDRLEQLQNLIMQEQEDKPKSSQFVRKLSSAINKMLGIQFTNEEGR